MNYFFGRNDYCLNTKVLLKVTILKLQPAHTVTVELAQCCHVIRVEGLRSSRTPPHHPCHFSLCINLAVELCASRALWPPAALLISKAVIKMWGSGISPGS